MEVFFFYSHIDVLAFFRNGTRLLKWTFAGVLFELDPGGPWMRTNMIKHWVMQIDTTDKESKVPLKLPEQHCR